MRSDGFDVPVHGGRTDRPRRATVPAAAQLFVGRQVERRAALGALDDSRLRVVLICGPAGVGKSRLALECLDSQSVDAEHRWICLANPTLSSVPFGAIAHLLPPEAVAASSSPGAGLAMFAAFRRYFGTAPVLILVDDLQHLDDASAGLLIQLINVASVRLVATLRDGATVPLGFGPVLQSEQAMRIDLGMLNRAETAELARQSLDGDLASSLEVALWESSQGNPLYVRELITGAVMSATVVNRDGIWTADGPLPVSRRLSDLLGDRLTDLSRRSRHLAETLSLCAPLGLEAIERQGYGNELAELERTGIATLRIDRMRCEARLSHPLYGEALRAGLIETSLRQILRTQADDIESSGMRRRGDELRVVMWRLEAGIASDRGALVRATNSASIGKDHELTARLATAAIRAGAGVDVIAPLGEALYELGRFDESIAVLVPALVAAENEFDVVRLAVALHRSQLWGQEDPDAAASTLETSRGRVRMPLLDDALKAALANVFAFSNRLVDALHYVEPIDSPIPVIATVAGVAHVTALTQLGRVEEALVVGRRHRELQAGYGDQADPVFGALHLMTSGLAQCEAGQMEAAHAALIEAYEQLLRHRALHEQVWASLALARLTLYRGHLREAWKWATETLANAELSGLRHGQRLALNTLAACAGQLHLPDEAANALDRIEQLDRGTDRGGGRGFFGAELAVGRAWAWFSNGDIERARDTVRRAADDVVGLGCEITEGFLRHEAARLGAADDRRNEALLSAVQGQLIAARALHIRGIAEHDADVLELAAAALAGVGCDLAAAEAARTAGRLVMAGGDARRARRLDGIADGHALACAGARTPGLRAIEPTWRLTDREVDVLDLAATGLTSKEMADRLFVAVRTIDNHLRNVFAKLNVTSRHELAALAFSRTAKP